MVSLLDRLDILNIITILGSFLLEDREIRTVKSDFVNVELAELIRI